MKVLQHIDKLGVIPKQQRSSRRNWWLTVLYAACLAPFSIDGFGVNYLFALIPVGYLLSGRALIRPNSDVALYIYACAAVFSLASLYQIDWIEFFDRRIISFALYMTMFALCFVPITDKHVASFKLSILIAGLLFSIQSLFLFMSLGAEAQSFESKDIVGGQRYGFVYILAFWTLWYDKSSINPKWVRLLFLLTLALGISLTFSRASLVAFVGSGAFAFLYTLVSGGVSPAKLLRNLAYGAAFMVLGLCVVYLIAPIIFDFFSVRLIEYVLSGSSSDALADPETSDGTRIFIWSHIIEFVLRNPLTGAGFLGVWALNLFDGFSGSSHSQYFDALFRLGLPLFIGYVYFLVKMWRYFRRVDAGIFFGFIGVLIYGVFHETFKESHGMFILAFLLAISTQRRVLQASIEKEDK